MPLVILDRNNKSKLIPDVIIKDSICVLIFLSIVTGKYSISIRLDISFVIDDLIGSKDKLSKSNSS